MQKKRIIALLLAGCMAMSAFLTGCGDTQKESSQNTESSSDVAGSTETQSTEEEVKLDPVTLSFWIPAAKTEDSDKVEAAINEYLKEVLPNTTIDITWISMSEWKDRWNKAAAAREAIDLTWFGYKNASMGTEVGNGSIMQLDDLVAEYGQGIVEVLGQDAVDLHRHTDGNLYFLPSWQGLIGNRFGLQIPHENVALMGDDWAKKFQAALYENWQKPFWDESKQVFATYMEELLEASKQAGKLRQGFYSRFNPVNLYYLSNAYTSDTATGAVPQGLVVYFDEAAKTYYVQANCADNSSVYQSLKVYADWMTKGYFRSDIASVDEGNVQFVKETPADQTYVNWCGTALTTKTAIDQSKKAGYDIDVFYLQEEAKYVDGFATGAAIPTTAKNPERAMMFLNLLYTDADLYQLLVYGIEGTHYAKMSDGTIAVPEAVSYSGVKNWYFGTCMNSLFETVEQLDTYEVVADIEKNAKVSALQGFKFDDENVSVEYSALKAVESEYYIRNMYTRKDWEKAWTEYTDKAEAAGIEAFINEYCAQLTKYAEAKGCKVVNMGF